MANYRHLVCMCVKALSTFDPNTTSIEDHLHKFLSFECLDENEMTFVKEVVAGCIQYRQLIKVVVSGYYSSHEGHSCLRADTHIYYVVCYLLLFRLDEMGMNVWTKIIQSQHTSKMYKFLSFILRDDNLNGWITHEWYKVYDKQFVDNSILTPLKRMYDDVIKHIEKIEDQLNNKSQPKPISKPHTEPVPFNITNPQPRSIPTPDKVPSMKPHKPVPQSTYTTPTEHTVLTEAFKTNRLKAQATLEEAERTQFSCANTEKSDKTKARMKDIVYRRETELQYRPLKAGPVPSSIDECPSVKLNTAAVLREGARVQNELHQQEKRLANLEAGERDDAEFTRWQEDMKQREAAERLAEIERRHLQAKLSYEDAIIARENHLKDRHLSAKAVKKESESLMESYFAEREEQHKELRRLVEVTTSSHQSAKEARLQLQAMKRTIVEGVAAENRALMAKALEEAEEEMKCRVELIQQIRAMERVPVMRTKLVDVTETGRQGLLVEMSVAELRERLSLMKVTQHEQEEKKRRDITANKQAKERLLSETKDSISRHRKEQNKQTANRQERSDAVFTKHHNELKEKNISQLQQQLLAKRKERERLQAESQVKYTLTGNRGRKKRDDSDTTPSSPSTPITSTLLHC